MNGAAQTVVRPAARRGLTRRAWLHLMGSAMAAAAIRAAPAAAARPDVDVGSLHASTFEPHVGTVFRVLTPGGASMAFTLIAVERGTARVGRRAGDAPVPTGGEVFALTFGAAGAADQGTYTFEHPTIGRFPLFGVPGGAPAGPATWRAAFCRLAPGATRLHGG